MSESKRLFLLDAYALVYRSYYAFIRSPMFNSKGMNTSAIFGFVNTLDDVLRKFSPSHIAVVFDLPQPTFRHILYSAYKANRQETPEDIRKAIPVIKEIISAYNIPILVSEGFEADDVIGTLAKQAEKKGFTTYMMTTDKDYCQLVSDTILIYKPKRMGNDAEILGVKEVNELFGIRNPSQVIDILALWGDSSDNIPGGKGIGEKTAKDLISEYGSIEGIFNNIDKIKEKNRSKLIESKENIELSKQLVTIVTDVPVTLHEDELSGRSMNKEALLKLYEELEFRSFIKKLQDVGSLFDVASPKEKSQPVQKTLFDNNDPPVDIPVAATYKSLSDTPHRYHLTDTPEKRQQLILQLREQQEFCFDTETTGIDATETELVGMSFCFKEHEAYYIPVPENREEAKHIAGEFRCVFENPEILKIGQNMKFDIMVLQTYDISVKGKMFDTMLAHYLLQPELRHNLNYLAEQYLGYSPVPIEELIGKKGKDQLSMRVVPTEKIKEYAAEDADITWQLKKILEENLRKTGLADLFFKIEMPLVPVLASIERNGVSLDVISLQHYGEVLRKDIAVLEKSIFQLAGTEFNISSPKQLGEILFERLKIDDNPSKTKTKQYSTGEEVLEKLKDKHFIIDKILDYRSLKKLLTTYVDALPKLIHTSTGKIHTSFNQAVTSTGRLSSNNPNLQNIPVREERGREIRKAFVASSSSHVFLSADYSQIELRLMAHLSEDTNMMEAFHSGYDIHAITAARINKVPLDAVTNEMRRQAKTANFGIIYGISSFGLSERLRIPRKDAKELIDNYFNTYPHVKEYMDKSIQSAREKGYVETIMGRRRYLSDINSRNATVRGFAERNAINAPIQGSAADIIKIAMIRIFQQLSSGGFKTRLILQVHDELNFDVPQIEMEEIKGIIRHEMEHAVMLKVPLTVDIGTGQNWLEAH